MPYTVRLGPLRFEYPIDRVTETVGDGVEAVGAALVGGERRPRPLTLKLPVRAGQEDGYTPAVGLRMRRQVRQLLDNAPARLSALYLVWDADDAHDGWYVIGGGQLDESEAGVGFGDFTLDLQDVYCVGRPATHRAGRRLDLADRRTGLVPRDTRGLLYSSDFAAQALPTMPLAIPAGITLTNGAQGRSVPVQQPGTRSIGGGSAHTDVQAVNGEVISYDPTATTRGAPIDVDEFGGVRVFDLKSSTTAPAAATYTAAGDADPTVYGWERVLGAAPSALNYLALENGYSRAIFAGNTLLLEWYDAAFGKMRRDLTLPFAATARFTIVELTSERGVVEARVGARAYRVVLQRGWYGPRIEGYDDDNTSAATNPLRLIVADGTMTVTTGGTPTFVDALAITPPGGSGRAAVTWYAARVTTDQTAATGTANEVTYNRRRVQAVQLIPGLVAPAGTPTVAGTREYVGSLSLAEAKGAAVVVARSVS